MIFFYHSQMHAKHKNSIFEKDAILLCDEHETGAGTKYKFTGNSMKQAKNE